MINGHALEGITVVSCEQAIAAPFATRQLADMGARVIKIEKLQGGDFARGYDETVRGLSSHFVWTNRSKESLTLDLKQPEGVEVVHGLLEQADVFVQNLAPGAIDRLGLSVEELRGRYPHLIICSISGYGSSGPYRDSKAYDLLIQSEAGLVSITGDEENPAKAGIPAADISAGMYAFSGILGALFERGRTGQGSAIEISLFDSLIEWMGYPMYYTKYGGSAPERAGTSHPAIAPYGTFTAGDGIDIVLAIQNHGEWASFCEVVLGDVMLAEDPRFDTGSNRVKNRAVLDEMIDSVFSAQTGKEMENRLTQANIAYARQREMVDVLDHPQLKARQRWQMVDTPAGPVEAVLPAINTVGRTARMGPVPALGEHTEKILDELGYSETQINRLKTTAVCGNFLDAASNLENSLKSTSISQLRVE